MENSNFTFECIIIKEKQGYSSLCIDIDVASEADTSQEAKNNLMEAVELYLESSIESNLPILRPVPIDENPLYTRESDVIEKFLLKVKFDLNVYV